jgi:hypothetical protein
MQLCAFVDTLAVIMLKKVQKNYSDGSVFLPVFLFPSLTSCKHLTIVAVSITSNRLAGWFEVSAGMGSFVMLSLAAEGLDGLR